MTNQLFPYSQELKVTGGSAGALPGKAGGQFADALVDISSSQSVHYEQILSRLGQVLTEERQNRITEVVARRTYSVATVLEDIYDRGNASAVMRSAEAMGFQPVHMIEKSEKFKTANRVTKGADKWLDVVRWKSTGDCVRHLKGLGYQILATHLDATAVPLGECDLTRPTAIVFGNEKDGISPEMQTLADRRVILPMQGFVQSYNISVAAAIALSTIFQARYNSGKAFDLTPEQQLILKAEFFLRSGDSPEQLLVSSGEQLVSSGEQLLKPL